MYVISNKRVNSAINDFVSKVKVCNGKILYPAVPVKDREFLTHFLNRFYFAFEKLFYDKREAAGVFIRRLEMIDAVRLDDEDKELLPIKYAFDEMKDENGDMSGGVFVPMKQSVVLIDLDFNKKTKAFALHTLIHEFIHAMTLIQIRGSEGSEYKCGVNKNGRAFYRLNEGITEMIAQDMWKAMYKHIECPGRYPLEVAVANMVADKYYSREQFIEDYIKSGVVLERELKKIQNSNRVNLFDFISSFDNKDFGNKTIQENFIKELKDFHLNICFNKK